MRAGTLTSEDGERWTIPLSSQPTADWMRLFHTLGDAVRGASPRDVAFSGATARFRCSADELPLWLEAIDTWIVATNVRYQEFEALRRRPCAARDHRCPSCGSSSVERIAARAPERTILRIVGKRVYVCRDCRRRFYDRPFRPGESAR